ncbi:MAG: bacterial Ig-like domain-containing protein [Clostridia bacterium]|nr:bacterial Ig-like domain-containing protein [Clostridia bacterium]
MVKKALCVFLAVFMFLSVPFVLPVSAEEASTGTYLVTASQGAKLYKTSMEEYEFVNTAPEGAYINIIKTENGFGYTVFDAVYGWVDLSSGVEFVDKMPSVTDKNKIEGAKAIHITRAPKKKTYVAGEESADITGLEVSLVFNDEFSSSMPVTGYKVAFPDLNTPGVKKVNVYYGGFSTSFEITVTKVPVTGIVIKKPSKTTYIEGEPVSFEGLSVTAYFSDGRNDGRGIVLDKGDYTIRGVKEGDTTLAPGTYEVTVEYMYPEITATFNIYVTEKSVKSLKLLKIPSSLNLYQGQIFNPSDFQLQATYDNGSTEIIKDFYIEYDNMQVGTGYTAKIYYMDKYVAFEYDVLELKETGIELGDTARVGSYAEDEISFQNLKVYIIYNSGEKKLIEDYELTHNIDMFTVGKYPVKVTYGDFSAEFEYTVAKRNETRIGDVNLDGVVRAADARLALRAAAKLENLSAEAFLAADVDFDEKVTAKDARKILRVSAGLEKF